MVGGRYHLVRLLGDGGMGAVYKAADQVLRRFVAIKLLHPATAQNPSAVERFVREARSAASIGHPNIIDILDFGTENNRPFLVMEYLRGRSLSQALASDGPFAVERAVNIATHTLAGLAGAHDQGILHRDLKPANLMLIAQLGDRDFVKICDFGFAALLIPKVRIDDAKTLTPARTLVGTPAYAAPERLRGDDRRDPRIDVYSVGVVLFEMLSGVRPFDAPSFRELAQKVKNDPPPSLRKLRNHIPPGLDRVVTKALAKTREERWANAEEFAAALVPFGGRLLAPDDSPSDSFTMDLLHLKARQTQRRRAMSPADAERILEVRSKPAIEVMAPKKPRAPGQTDTDLIASAPSDLSIESLDETLPSSSVEAHSSTNRQIHMPEGRAPAKTLPPTPSLEQLRGPTQWPPASDTQPHPAPAMAAPVMRPPPSFGTDRAPPPEFTPPALHVPPHLPMTAVPAVTTSGRAYSGAMVLTVMRFVARRFGERALMDVLQTLEPTQSRVFQQGITPEAWVSYDTMNTFISQVDRQLGRDDLHLVLLCGRAAAEGAFERMRSIQPPSPAPELLLAEMPTIARELLQGVDLRVKRIGKGYSRLEMHEHGESSLVACVSILGFLDRSLDRFGAAEVEVNLLSCVALGDPMSLFDISWLT